MVTFMKKYKVQLKGNKKSQLIDAHGYTIKDGKRYFHEKEDLSDFEFFFIEKEIVSFTEVKPFEGIKPFSIDM
jgi:hypothetical protein